MRFKKRNKRNLFIKNLVLIISVIIVVQLFNGFMEDHQSMEHKTETFTSLKNSIQEELRPEHKYRCCLDQPCMYCIEKTPGHGEGASCDCLNYIILGIHPCGECIGEILEGHGNPYLAEYFATAIAEEVGEQHLSTLKQIIFEKYDYPITEQN